MTSTKLILLTLALCALIILPISDAKSLTKRDGDAAAVEKKDEPVEAQAPAAAADAAPTEASAATEASTTQQSTTQEVTTAASTEAPASTTPRSSASIASAAFANCLLIGLITKVFI